MIRRFQIYNLFRKKNPISRFYESILEFREIRYRFIFVKFKYFAEQIIYVESPDYALQNDIWYVHMA